MEEETFNLQVRKYLKKVGVNSQREIDLAVRNALEAGRLKGDETLSAKTTVHVPDLDLEITIDGEITLA